MFCIILTEQLNYYYVLFQNVYNIFGEAFNPSGNMRLECNGNKHHHRHDFYLILTSTV